MNFFWIIEKKLKTTKSKNNLDRKNGRRLKFKLCWINLGGGKWKKKIGKLEGAVSGLQAGLNELLLDLRSRKQVNVALYSVKRNLYLIKKALNSIEWTVFYQKSPAWYQQYNLTKVSYIWSKKAYILSNTLLLQKRARKQGFSSQKKSNGEKHIRVYIDVYT